MANISWYVNRLRAMSVKEVLWRLSQKKLEKKERQTFGKQHNQITEKVFYRGKEDLAFHVEKLSIGSSECQSVNRAISLLGGYSYEKYCKDWHAGFQSENRWLLTFSYELQYKQRDEIGDARTNWELNRHFQFALLACDYTCTGRSEYLTELSDLFSDWNKENPFLHGISWTSVMEVAIRDINWMYTLGFLKKALQKQSEPNPEIEQICEQLRVGIINMTSYVANHYSRYSSANNHVIVEAAAMGMAGIVMNCKEWSDAAFLILNHEIPRQNYGDGINKEVSLHYQSFFMEAVGLLVLTMQKNGIQVPPQWCDILTRMSRYVSDCQGNYGEIVVFGDDDEGKILDLEGITEGGAQEHRSHYSYVLQLMSLILQERYVREITDKTLLRITSQAMREQMSKKLIYENQKSVCYEEGGISLLKSDDRKVLIGVDHGELGFGSIAAHGHADALSFQMFLEGTEVFGDAGTFIYHVDLENRNAFRKTENHNTVTVDGKDQSEMLGAFLWGKRAKTGLLQRQMEGELQYVEAEHNGYAPLIHRRRFELENNCLKIFDKLLGVEKEVSYQMNFLLGAECKAKVIAESAVDIRLKTGQKLKLQIEAQEADMEITLSDSWISKKYGVRQKTQKISASGNVGCGAAFVTTITWENEK